MNLPSVRTPASASCEVGVHHSWYANFSIFLSVPVTPSFSQSTLRRSRWSGLPLASNELTTQHCLKQVNLGSFRIGTFLYLLWSDSCPFSPRRCQVGRTSFWGAKVNLPTLASSVSRTASTTCSFSRACTLHVEYTILVTLGTNTVTPDSRERPGAHMSLHVLTSFFETRPAYKGVLHPHPHSALAEYR